MKHSTWSYIEDELKERGWSKQDMAERMGGDVELNLCGLAFLEHTDDSRLTIGGFADGIARAFGTSAELWVNIDLQYRRELNTP